MNCLKCKEENISFLKLTKNGKIFRCRICGEDIFEGGQLKMEEKEESEEDEEEREEEE